MSAVFPSPATVAQFLLFVPFVVALTAEALPDNCSLGMSDDARLRLRPNALSSTAKARGGA